MLSPIFAKAIADRWRAMAIAAGALAVWLPLAMAIYNDIDISVYTDLPEAVRELMGIPDGAEPATLAYNVMLDFAAALTLAGMAVSIGSAAIAGEERNGTLGLLLGNPKSRRHVLAAKMAAMLLLIAAAVGLLWGVAATAPVVLNVEIGDTHVAATMLHLAVNTAFYGLLAMAVSAWSGNRALSSALPTGVMVLSYFAVGLLPLVSPLRHLAKAFPWYYFSGGVPLVRGVQWGHVTVLLTGCVAAAVVAFVGFDRRDLRGPTVGTSALDRLRQNPRTQRVFERLAGSTRVSRPWIKTAAEHQGLLFVTATTMFLVMGLLMGPMYIAIEADIARAADDFPAALLAIAGNGDLSTPEGWFQVETFSLMAPIAVMIATVTIGARGLAGEEANRTMGLLLANPIRRSSIVLEQAIAMTVYAGAVGLAIFSGVAGANLISRLGMDYSGIAATSLLVTLLGLVFGAVALALSAATGSVKAAVYGTVGLALTSHLLNALLPLSNRRAGYAELTPHHYFLGGNPLVEGMQWRNGALLAVLTLGLIAAAASLFDRRDLRS